MNSFPLVIRGSSCSLRCRDVDLQLKVSGPVIVASSLESLKRSFIPFTNICDGKSISLGVCTVERIDP